ncbi:MAG: VOC family protein [Cytophagaceae bacterium]|nr:VOC family protein [Cytophagaceae bacterium]MBK9936564.1 VOC family protein [Cytophagaceae bacterium]MBL0300319.1 VOC family protein [Cytophagaceae bacterium]MBL0327251.1 VOC family protein [Cytophagaceae bacterium]
MPKITHIAIYCLDLEKMRMFYEKYFGAKSNEKYINVTKGFESYFLSLEDGCALEIMTKLSVKDSPGKEEMLGLTHLAISVGSKAKVDELTILLEQEGFSVIGQPRTTGDGFYESVVLDPENNRLEITV